MKLFMEKAARWKIEIDEEQFALIANDVGIEILTLQWTFTGINDEPVMFVKKTLLAGLARPSPQRRRVFLTPTGRSSRRLTRSMPEPRQ